MGVTKEEVIRNSPYPTLKEAMRYYLEQVWLYKQTEEFFSQEGFTLPIAQKILFLAQLPLWDAYQLFMEAKKIPDRGTYLEIGGFVGGSLVCVHLATQLSGCLVNLISIDSFFDKLPNAKKGITTESQFHKNTEGIPHTLIKSTSDMAKDRIDNESVDLLFVDGSHRYGQVKRDIQNYWSKVKGRGILLGHDYNIGHLGVMQAVDELFNKERFTILQNSSMWRLIK